MIKNVQIYTKAGLTMVETLVALSVLVSVLAASSLAIQSAFQDRRYAARQSVATYLLNDGLEVLRQIRDSDAVIAVQNGDLTSNPLLALPEQDYYFTIDSNASGSLLNKILYCVQGTPTTTAPGNPSATDPIDCPISTTGNDEDFGYVLQSASDDLSAGEYRRHYRVVESIPNDTNPTKKRIESAVEWSFGATANQYDVITELSNVNIPSS